MSYVINPVETIRKRKFKTGKSLLKSILIKCHSQRITSLERTPAISRMGMKRFFNCGANYREFYSMYLESHREFDETGLAEFINKCDAYLACIQCYVQFRSEDCSEKTILAYLNKYWRENTDYNRLICFKLFSEILFIELNLFKQ